MNREDLPALRELFLSVRRETFKWLDSATFQLDAFAMETAGEFILVAHAGETIAGFISVWLPGNFVHHLYVSAAFQRSGVGTALLKAIGEKVDGPVRLKCLQKNQSAIAFYQKNGFVNTGEGGAEEESFFIFERTY